LRTFLCKYIAVFVYSYKSSTVECGTGGAIESVIWNEQYFSFGFTASSFQTLTVSSANPLLIADKTLAYDATALLTAALRAPFNYPAATAGFLRKSLW
jgi:hypothetical protein